VSVSVRFTPATGCVSIAAATTILAVILGGPAQAATKPSIKPDSVTGCTPSQSFSLKSLSYQTLGIPSIYAEMDNKGTTAATLSLGKSGSSATTYEISATEGVDAGVIFAKVSASSTQSISYTHTTSYQSTAGVTVPGKEYGWIGAGTKYVTGNGTETITYGNCTSAGVSVSLFRFPEANSGDDYIGDETKTDLAAPPWTMAP
jgi:hypothetical protein